MPDIDPNWIHNEGARKRVSELLEESGALLEARVSAVCDAFAASFSRKRVHVSAAPLAYGSNTTDSPLRQIDQCVTLYHEFLLSKHGGVILKLTIPIEVKFRKGLEVIGVSLPEDYYRPRVPTIGFVQGTHLENRLRLDALLSDAALTNPVFLEFDGHTPKKVFGEKILFNVGASLYDFINFENMSDAANELKDGITVTRLMKEFRRYVQKKRYAWWDTIHSWMDENISAAAIQEFNAEHFRGVSTHLFEGIDFYLPVFCTNGQLKEYETSGSTASFANRESLLARIRVPGWPGALRTELINYTAEAPLLVTNVANLRAVLDKCYVWFRGVEQSIKSTDSGLIERCYIEHAFYKAAVKFFLKEESVRNLAVRSDLDIFQWF
jgi:hypothetical protein